MKFNKILFIALILLMGKEFDGSSFFYVHGSKIIVGNSTIPISLYWHISSPKINNEQRTIMLPSNIEYVKFVTCNDFPSSRFTFENRAVVSKGYNGCSFSRHAKVIQNANSSMAIIRSNTPFIECHSRSGDFSSIKIPVFLVSDPHFDDIIESIQKNSLNNLPTYIIVENDSNSWEKNTSNAGWIVLEVIVLLVHAICIVVSIRALILSVFHNNVSTRTISIQQMHIINNIVGSFIVMMSIFDPWNVRMISDYSFNLIVNYIYIPPLLTCILLLAFFFHEVLLSKGFIEPKLDKLKWPFGFVIICIYGSYIVEAILFATYNPNKQLTKSNATLTLIFFLLAELYFITVSVILVKRLLFKKKDLFFRMLSLFIIINIGVLLMLTAICINLNQVYSTRYYDAYLTFVVWTIFWIANLFIIPPLVFYFRNPKIQSSKNFKSLQEKNGRPSLSRVLDSDKNQGL